MAGGMCGRGACVAGGMHDRRACMQERWPLKRAGRILLECHYCSCLFFQEMVQFKVLFDFKCMAMRCHVV